MKAVYGEQYHDEIEARSTEEIVELAGNLTAGVPMGTPVFDGAEEQEIKSMLELAGYEGSGQTKLYEGRTVDAFQRV